MSRGFGDDPLQTVALAVELVGFFRQQSVIKIFSAQTEMNGFVHSFFHGNNILFANCRRLDFFQLIAIIFVADGKIVPDHPLILPRENGIQFVLFLPVQFFVEVYLCSGLDHEFGVEFRQKYLL